MACCEGARVTDAVGALAGDSATVARPTVVFATEPKARATSDRINSRWDSNWFNSAVTRQGDITYQYRRRWATHRFIVWGGGEMA
jgi:hypothetical protein